MATLASPPPLDAQPVRSAAPVRSISRTLLQVTCGVLLVAAALWLASSVTGAVNLPRPEARYVAYRSATHLASGAGPYYNADEPAPVGPPLLQVGLLALGKLAGPLPLPAADTLINTLLLGLIAALLTAFLANNSERPLSLPIALGAGALYLLGALPWQVLHSAQPLAVLLGVGACLASQYQNRELAGLLSGLLVGLGCLAQPELLLLVGLLALTQPRLGRYLIGVTIPLLALAGLVIVAHVPWRPLWVGPEITNPVDLVRGLLEQNAGLALYLPLMLLGWPRLPNSSRLLTAWSALHVLVTWLLIGQTSYLPLWLGLIVLAAHGLDRLPWWLRLGTMALLAWLQFGALPHAVVLPADEQAQVGQWLAEHTPASATVAGDQVGELAYLANRHMTDLDGRLDPTIGAALDRTDPYFGLFRSLPDYVVVPTEVLRTDKSIKSTAPVPDAPWFKPLGEWFTQVYQPVYAAGSLSVYKRQADALPLGDTQPIEQPIGPRLRLVGLAQDRHTLTPGGLLRVRLDWQVSAGTAPYRLDLSIFSLSNELLGLSVLNLGNTNWNTSTFSTYHLIKLQDQPLPAGLLPMLVKVSYLPPEPEPPAPVVTHIRARQAPPALPESQLGIVFGSGSEQACLRAASVSLSPEKKVVIDLFWQGMGATRQEYRAFLHLHPAGDLVTVIDQSDGVPVYPTTTWDAGEILTDHRELNAANLAPGHYTLNVGLYTPETGRLNVVTGSTPDNAKGSSDSLTLFTVNVSADRQIAIESTASKQAGTCLSNKPGQP